MTAKMCEVFLNQAGYADITLQDMLILVYYITAYAVISILHYRIC